MKDQGTRRLHPAVLVPLFLFAIPYLRFFDGLRSHARYQTDAESVLWVCQGGIRPELFEHDLYYTTYRRNVRALIAWYDLFGRAGFDVLDVAEATTFVLGLILYLSIWSIGARLFGPWGGALFACLYAATIGPPCQFWGGLSRGFGLAFLTLFLACAVGEGPKRRVLGLLALGAIAVIYPLHLVVTATWAALRLVASFLMGQRPGRYAWLCLALSLACVALTLLVPAEVSRAGGFPVTKEMMQTDAHWTGERPRIQTWPVNVTWWQDIWWSGFWDGVPCAPLVLRWARRDWALALLPALVMVGVLVLWGVSLRRRGPDRLAADVAAGCPWRSVAPELFLFPLAALAVHAIAGCVIPAAYLPRRYLTTMFVLGLNVHLAAASLEVARWRGGWVGRVLVGGGIAICFLFNMGAREPSTYGINADLTEQDRTVLSAISKLPEDAVVFTPLRIGSTIPLMARRSVHWNGEAYHALDLRYAEELDRRCEAGIRFLTEGDVAGLAGYGVTHVLVDKRTMRPGQSFDDSWLFSPLYERFKGAKLTYRYEVENVVYEDRAYLILELE